MNVIGIGGQFNSGKDTLADYLARRLNEPNPTPHWERIGFANAVKKVFMDTFDVSWEFIEEWKRNPEPPPGFDLPIRQCLQFIGDGFRKMKGNIWIEVALRRDRNIILGDCRYLNETQAIRASRGLIVLVWRKDWENNDPNPSESQIKPTVDWFVNSGLEGDVRAENLPADDGLVRPGLFDFFIKNDGSVADLYGKVDELLLPALSRHFVGEANDIGYNWGD